MVLSKLTVLSRGERVTVRCQHVCRLLLLLLQVKWAKLRGTPGSPPEKLAEAEREVNEAETRLRDTKIAYEVRDTIGLML